MTARNLLMLGLVVLSAILAGCGGSTSVVPQDNNPVPNVDLQHPDGPGMPAATPDDFQLGPDGKSVSNTYLKFFSDSVNQASSGRWSVTNSRGQKFWQLSNQYFTSPKSWFIGGNYWNDEIDSLKSNPFLITDGTDGIRLMFAAKWKIQSGDSLRVYWWDAEAQTTQLVTTFTNGQNPDYPNYTRYYYELPANFSGQDHDNEVEFFFKSNSSGTDWGASIDEVAVYQRQLEAITDLSASDGGFTLDLSWSHNDAGTLNPSFYDVYRADDSGGGPGTYSYLDTVSYPTNVYTDQSAAPNTTYWYKVVARRPGWPDSADSNEDSGFYQGFN